MNEATHNAMSLAVATALGWKGDVKLLGKNAMYPDEVRAVEVEGLGAHVFSKNLASLCHFTRPLGSGKFGGYSWLSDKSVPSLDFTKRKVIPKPEAWGFPITPALATAEPFGKLVRDLIEQKTTIEADQITFTAASIMSEWVQECFIFCAKNLKGEERQKALDTLAGWACHLSAQDPAVPHHAVGVLLMGHSGFEGDVDECYNKMRGDGTLDALLKTMKDVKASYTLLRTLAEETATKSYVNPKKLEWRCVWRRGWDKMVRSCVLRGLGATAQTIRVLQGIEAA